MIRRYKQFKPVLISDFEVASGNTLFTIMTIMN